MKYEGTVYRPPSEARSLIIQVTIGCSHNGCTFCPMYKAKKFRMRPYEDVVRDLEECRRTYRYVERIFFADGDALCLATEKLIRLLKAAGELFPECRRISVYGRAGSILRKSEAELSELKQAGLGIIYMGAESGSAEVLRRVNKGETPEQLVQAVKKSEAVGIPTSVTFISGLGGQELMEEHSVKTGQMIGEMGASYVGLLTLMLAPGTPLFDSAVKGEFKPITTKQVEEELKLILTHADCKKECVFRSNHASNHLVLKGTLPQNRGQMLAQVERALQDGSYR